MPDDDRFLAPAQSVADSIAALARPAVGGARWETRSYTGQPQYSTAIFGGTAGDHIVRWVTRDAHRARSAEAAR